MGGGTLFCDVIYRTTLCCNQISSDIYIIYNIYIYNIYIIYIYIYRERERERRERAREREMETPGKVLKESIRL